MKHLTFIVLAAAFFCSATVFADSSAFFSWSLLFNGSWEESSTLHNRGELKLNFLPLGLTFKAGVLDRRPLDFELDSPWGDPEKWVTHFLGGLYHNPTGSRLLFGVIDEYGLSARIRNPWIRSPPYTENHKPLMADLRTAASSTKEDELYLYLSTPLLNLPADTKLRLFFSAQTEILTWENVAFAAGLDFTFANKTGLLLEFFHTGATLPASKNSAWFTYPPPLPEREFNLYAASILFYNQLISVSSDFAVSETFAWGTDIYANFGISLTPLLPTGRITRPLSISIAADGAGKRFVFRDGSDYNAGFRVAAKIEWKGSYSSLFRVDTVLRGSGFGESFTRSSTGIYYRFPSNRSGGTGFPVRLTVISINADRNADNPEKITDRLYGNIGFSINLTKIGINSPLGVRISGSIRGLTASDSPSPYPIPDTSWVFDETSINCTLTWSPSIFQFNTAIGYSNNSKNDEKWGISFSTAVLFNFGRLSIKASVPGFGEKWSWTVSWRLEKK